MVILSADDWDCIFVLFIVYFALQKLLYLFILIGGYLHYNVVVVFAIQ